MEKKFLTFETFIYHVCLVDLKLKSNLLSGTIPTQFGAMDDLGEWSTISSENTRICNSHFVVML